MDLRHWAECEENGMYIKSVSIDEFGKFTDFSLQLSSGLNIIEGDNETGKSTVGMFIKFMFYGLNAAEREKYIGWGKNCCRGSLTLVSGGHEYKIERSLMLLARGVKESVGIFDENLTPVFADQTPDKVFLGVSEKVFVSSAYVGAVSGAYVDGEKLTDAVENLLFSADETTNTAKALKKLDEERAALLHKNKKGGELFELKNSIAECEARLAEAQAANSDIFKTEERVICDRAKREENAKTAQSISAKLDEYDAYLAIAKIGKCTEQGTRAEAAVDAYSAKKESLTVNGKLPDGGYARDLHTFASELSSLEKELEESEERLKGVESSLTTSGAEDESVSLLIEEMGGEHTVLSAVEDLESKQVKKKNMSILFAVAAFLLMAGGVVLLLFKSKITALPVSTLEMVGAGCLGAGVLCALLCLIFAVGKGKAEAAARELVGKFNCEDSRELTDMIDRVKAREITLAKKRANIENAAQNSFDIKEKLQAKKTEISEYTAKYSPTEPSPELLTQEAMRIDKELAELAELKAEAEKQTALYAQLRAETADTDTDAVKSKIKGVLKREELETFDEQEQRNRLKFLTGSIESLDKRILENEKQLAALTAATRNPADIADRLGELRQRYAAGMKMHSAFELAHEKLQQASLSLRGSICPKLSAEAGEYMNMISEGKYGRLGINESYGITAEAEGETRNIGVFSTGTADIAYISLRLALISVLYRKATPFVMFDDSFAHLDDGRLSAVLALLCTKGKNDSMQSIVFTCGKREGDISSSLPYTNIIKMQKA